MRKTPRNRFRTQYQILHNLKENYSITDEQLNTIQPLIFSGGKSSKFLTASQDYKVVLSWIQKHLDPNFTEFQLYKNFSQPCSVETSIPTKKQKHKETLENKEDSEKTNVEKTQGKRVKEDIIKEKEEDERHFKKQNESQEKENDFLERISIKSLIE
jgi:hypothetical protein